MSDILVTTTNRNVLVTERSIDVVVSNTNIDVEVTGGRGPAGASATRMLYVVEIRRDISDEIIVLNEMLNTTGKTFTWSLSGATGAQLKCDDTLFIDNVLSVNYLSKTTNSNHIHRISKSTSKNALIFGVADTSVYFINTVYIVYLEFYNY